MRDRITYVDEITRASIPQRSVKVYLLGNHVGTIRRTDGGGWCYYPKDHKIGGETFISLEACKQSLEN